MKKKHTPFYLLIVLLLLVNGYYYILPIIKDANTSLEKVAFEATVNSEDLVNSFISNEAQSNEQYAGKIIEVVGFVKDVTFLNNRNTVILYGKKNTSGVICDVHSSQINKVKTLQKHQKIKVKGICKGFLKDVVLLNCYIEVYE